ncbi:MAG: menaquinone biosynthesis protein [Bacteroidia bacterium]|jgi:chorismate dehydratase|nr:menaquinone biosynthesis protein [Bacteroidia bacterium]
MLRISAVSYLNTRPFLYGLRQAGLPGVEISVDIPAECARKLRSGEADIGLVPVATIPALPAAHILPHWCIGAEGAVESVMLYSEVPLHEITTVLLDYQSRTSVNLARVLAAEHWKISPHWQAAQPGFETQITGTTAGVVIGDRTFALNHTHRYEYDLAAEWKALTGLPFVFAAWVSTTPLSEEFVTQFTNALQLGIENMDTVIAQSQPDYPGFDIAHYLNTCISYPFTGQKQQALEIFLKKLAALPQLP